MRTAAPRFSLKPDSSRPRLLWGLMAVVIVSALAAAVPAAAQNRSLPLYSIQRDAAELSSIDPLTGEEVAAAVALVDADAVETITGGTSVAVSPDGDLFAIICLTDPCSGAGTRVLGLIDPATGDVTIIGEITVDDTPLDRISDLTFGADGTLYGITGRDFPPENTLFTIDPETGEATEVVDLTIGTLFNRGNAIAFNPEDELIYHLTFDSDAAAVVLRTLNPAAADVAASIAPVALSGDTIAGLFPRSIEYFGNGFFLVLDADVDMYLVASTGETRFLSSDQSVTGTMHGLAFAGAPPSCPQALYGAANSQGNSGDSPSALYAIDPATGEATLIGPIGFERVNGIEFLLDASLIGVGETQDGNNTQTAILIDPCTGLGTAIGATTANSPPNDLSVRSSDGALFGVLDFSLHAIDATTGVATLIGDLSATAGNCCGWGIAFDPADDTLFLAVADQPATPVLFTVDDPDTSAAVTTVATMTIPAEAETEAARVNSMAFDGATGDLLGSLVDGGQAFATGPFHWLVNIDKATADVTLIGETQTGLNAIASAAAFADVEIVKEVSQSTAVVGQRLSYFITVTNNGVADATNVIVVDDPLPVDFTVDTIIVSQGTCTGTTAITCELGDIAAGDSVDIEFRGEATAAAPLLSNEATVVADQSDTVPANNSSTADSSSANFTVTVSPASLDLTIGGSGTLNVTVTVTDGSVDEEIDLECLVLTGDLLITCVFNPADVTPGTGTATSTATVTVAAIIATNAPPPSSRPAAPLYAVWLGLPLAAFFGTMFYGGRRKQVAFALAVALLVLAMLPLAGCNNGDEEVVPQPKVATLQIVGELGAHVVNSSTVTVTVP